MVLRSLIYLFLLLLPIATSCQITSDTKDYQTALKRLRVGTDTSKYFTSIVTTISNLATHRQSPTAKAVYDYIQTFVNVNGDLSGTLPNPTVDGLQGRAVSSTAPTTGQVLEWNGSAWAPATDDTGGGGVTDGDKGDIDVTGSGIIWTVDTNAITNIKVADGAINTAELVDGAVTMAKINQSSATTGQVIKWNGSAWAPATDDAGGSNYQTLRDDDTGMTQRAAANFVTSSQVAFALTDDAANGETEIRATIVASSIGQTELGVNSVSSSEISTGAVGTTEIADGAVSFADIQNIATARVLGRTTAGSGSVEELSAGAGISIASGAITNTGDTNGADDVTTSTTAGGDLSGTYPNPTVDGLQGRAVSATAPTSGQVLEWNGSAWAPATDDTGSGGYATLRDEGVTQTQRTQMNFVQTSTIDINVSDDAGTPESDISAYVRQNSLSDFHIATGGVGTDEILNGDILAEDLSQMGATTGQVLKWNGTAWAPGTDNSGGGGANYQTFLDNGSAMTQQPNANFVDGTIVSFSLFNDGANTETEVQATIIPNSISSTEIGTSAVGSDEIAADAVGSSEIATDAVGSAEIAANAVGTSEISNGSVAFADIQNIATARVLGRTTAGSGSVEELSAGTGISIASGAITNTGDTNSADDITTSTTAGGDLSGTYPNPTVDGLQGRAVSSTAPTTGQVLEWNGSAWAPATDDTGGGSTNYQTFRDDGTGMTQRANANFVSSSQISLVLTDDAANNETEISPTIIAGSITATEIATDGVGAAEIAADAVGTSEITTDGVGAAEIAAGAVGTSEIADASVAFADIQNIATARVLGRTTAGSGSVEELSAGTGISIASGAITNTGDTNSADDVTTSTTAGGDLNGTYPNPTVDGLQGRAVSSTAPTTGQVLEWNGSAWAPATDDTGGGSTNYQTFRDDGAGMTQRANANFVSSSQISLVLTDDAANNETEISPTIIAGSVTATEIATDGVGAAEIAADAVGTSEITTDGVGAAEIAAGAVGTSEIADASVAFADIQNIATARVLGRTTAGSGSVEELSAGTGISIASGAITNTGDTNSADDVTTSTTAGGDLSGTYPNPTVDGLQGRAVSSTAPTTGQVLEWNGSAWAPATDDTGGGSTNYQTFRDDGTGMTQRANANFVSSSQISLVLTDDAANNETEISPTIIAGSVTATEIATDGVGAAEIAADAVGTSEIATDGVGAAEIAAGAVGTSEIADASVAFADIQNIATARVLGRTTAGSGSVEELSAGTGISIASGAITNTGDTNSADDVTTSTTAGGDLSGTYPNPTVDGLQGRAVSSTAPTTGQVLEWNGSAWAPSTDDSGAPSGTSTQTLRYDASNVLVANSQITNNGNEVGIGGAPSSGTELKVYGLTEATAAFQSTGAGSVNGSTSASAIRLNNTTAASTWFIGNDNTGNLEIYAGGLQVIESDPTALTHTLHTAPVEDLVETLTTTQTLTNDQYIILANPASGSVTFTLPATIILGKKYRIFNIGADGVTINASGGHTINGATNITMEGPTATQVPSVEIIGISSTAWAVGQQEVMNQSVNLEDLATSNADKGDSFLFDGSNWTVSPAPRFARTTGIVTNSTTSLADVTGLSFAVVSGEHYRFKAVITYTSAAVTTGSAWTLSGPSGTVAIKVTSPLTSTSEHVLYQNALNTNTPSTGSFTTSASNMAIIEGVVHPTANGTYQLRFASEVASSAITVQGNSVLEYVKI